MAKFMDVHHGFAGVAECQLREARERDLVTEAAEGRASRAGATIERRPLCTQPFMTRSWLPGWRRSSIPWTWRRGG
jgi:hypothetical protein